MDWWLLCHMAQSICIKSVLRRYGNFLRQRWPPPCKGSHASAEPTAARWPLLSLRHSTRCSFFCSIYQGSTCSCIFPFCCFNVFLPFFFKTCSKPRLKLTLLRDRYRDKVPIIRSTELFIANKRNNKIG